MMEEEIHLCNDCTNKNSFPECLNDIDNVEFGSGKGNDNIIHCNSYSKEGE